MNNPFVEITERLTNIEASLNQIKNNSTQTDPTEPSKEFLTVDEVAALLRLTKPTVYTKCHKRELPYMKRGSRLYFSKDDIVKYIKEGYTPTAEQLEEKAHIKMIAKL